GQCGGRIEVPAAPAPSTSAGKTMFFSGVQVSGVAKLVVVKANSADGLAYELGGTEHVVGRTEGAILFPEDPLVSPRHANFLYREGKLFVRDDGSINGVFVRIHAPARLESGGVFLLGEQLLQVEALPPDFGPQPDAEGTYFYASPKRASKMRIIQRLRGGEIGLVVRARGDRITLGREGNDINFPDDPFISGRHAEVSIGSDGVFSVTDLGSKNGTFMRIVDESPLEHGDYVFLGQQLLRVEIS
ncbi:MAG TPA: FHA domain-containing protein, partial [Polyangia bacterium]